MYIIIEFPNFFNEDPQKTLQTKYQSHVFRTYLAIFVHFSAMPFGMYIVVMFLFQTRCHVFVS